MSSFGCRGRYCHLRMLLVLEKKRIRLHQVEIDNIEKKKLQKRNTGGQSELARYLRNYNYNTLILVLYNMYCIYVVLENAWDDNAIVICSVKLFLTKYFITSSIYSIEMCIFTSLLRLYISQNYVFLIK